MKKLLLSFALITIYTITGHAQNVYKEFLDGRVYVKFTKASLKNISREDPRNIPLTKLTTLRELFNKYGVTKASIPFYQADDDEILPYILKFEFSQASKIDAFIDELTLLKNVDYAEKVRLNKTDVLPNDPLFATVAGSTHLNQINAPNAWNVFNGNSNITVAIVDNAIMGGHADLIGNTYTNTVEANGTANVDDDANGYVDDINGYDVAWMDGVTNPTFTIGQDHGTHCAGIAGANNNNSIGIGSIGWNIKIIPVKASFDTSPSINVDFGYEGILYAVKAKARIISCSWGNSGGSSLTEQYLIDYAWNRGCIIFASAGNLSSTTPNYPGAYNHVYCVAAVTPSDIKSSYSNYGSWVDISAPGDNILSTTPYTSSAAYLTYSGTSMATPMVAGLAGLMLSKSPYMTRTDVLNCISNTAVNIYTLGGNSSFVSGSQLGAGRIDAFAAMNCAATYSAIPPVANFYAFLPNTCPNTSIPFIDSSLYNPTSWSWTFQNGTPATSTSSNPSVQWTTAGTYSVSLTASNTNGSNTKTKISYITVSAPSATSLPFSEGFQSTQFLPTGWLANNIFNDNLYWQRFTGVGGFGTSTACAMFDNFTMNAPGERDEMRTPKFDFSSVATASLFFDVAYARYNATFSDTLEVKVSTNCGTTWTSIYLKGGTALSTTSDQSSQFVPTSSQWRTDAINISTLTAGQPNVMFSFLNRGRYGQAIYVDNINLAFPSPTLNVSSSASICVVPTYTFSNTSLGAVNYTWNFQGGSPASSTASNPSVAYASPGTYTFNLSAVNGTATSSITKTITVVANPTVSSMMSNYCSGTTYTLNGTGATSYTWISSSGPVGNTSSLVIVPVVNSTYTLSGSNGVCSSQGPYIINVLPSPTLTAANQTICAGNSATLVATGANSYSWSTGITSSVIIVAPTTNTTYLISGTIAPCSSIKTVSVNVVPLPTSVISSSNAACSNSCNGIVSAATTGGPGPYTYSLAGSNCATLPCIGLCAGSYTLLSTNSSGCQSSTTVSISAPAVLQSVVNVTNAACSNCATGILSVSPIGGTAPYTYTWAPSGGNAATAQSLLPGCYTVTIMDFNGCASQTNSCVGSNTGLRTNALYSSLQIYPNPAKSIVIIEFKGAAFSYVIYNNLGQLIASKKNNQDFQQIDLSGYAKGIYQVEVESGVERVRKKLVLE